MPPLLLLLLALGLAAADVQISGDLSRPSTIVPNVWDTLTVWDAVGSLSTPAPADIGTRYPFLRYAQLFTATGGCYRGFPNCGNDRDLFVDPAAGLKSGVNASRLFAPLRNILAAGWTPHIVTGNVPIALSAKPLIGAFGVNSQPPADLGDYRTYIAAIAAQLRDEFTLPVVAQWRWGVFTEYNNQDWLVGDGASYADIYDYTVCGLADALGEANVNIGVHACVQCQGSPNWDPLQFLQHAATGKSACTGGPVHLNWTGNSFYEHTTGEPGDLSWWPAQGASVLTRARELGLPADRFGIDEGRILWGPEGSAFALTTRAVGDAYQASFDALMFKLVVSSGAPQGYLSRWGVNADTSVFQTQDRTVDNVATNVARLCYSMAGSAFVATTNTTTTTTTADANPVASSMVDAVVGVRSSSEEASSLQRISVLLFHHFPLLNDSGVAPVPVHVQLCGTQAPSRPALPANITRVDDEHANFFPLWVEAWNKANLSHANGDFSDGWSAWSDNMPLSSSRAVSTFQSVLPSLQAAAELVTENFDGASTDAQGCLTFSVVMPPHSVALVDVFFSQ
jgi:hypothetical protein